VRECYEGGDWIVDFKRAFSPGEVNEWEKLLEMLREVNPSGGQDRMRWCLEKSRKYTTKSMYRALSHRRVVNIRMRKIWGQSCQ
jgi:hypothetical protein